MADLRKLNYKDLQKKCMELKDQGHKINCRGRDNMIKAMSKIIEVPKKQAPKAKVIKITYKPKIPKTRPEAPKRAVEFIDRLTKEPEELLSTDWQRLCRQLGGSDIKKLRDIAKKAGITGYTEFSKKELCVAIAEDFLKYQERTVDCKNDYDFTENGFKYMEASEFFRDEEGYCHSIYDLKGYSNNIPTAHPYRTGDLRRLRVLSPR